MRSVGLDRLEHTFSLTLAAMLARALSLGCILSIGVVFTACGEGEPEDAGIDTPPTPPRDTGVDAPPVTCLLYTSPSPRD